MKFEDTKLQASKSVNFLILALSIFSIGYGLFLIFKILESIYQMWEMFQMPIFGGSVRRDFFGSISVEMAHAMLSIAAGITALRKKPLGYALQLGAAIGYFANVLAFSIVFAFEFGLESVRLGLRRTFEVGYHLDSSVTLGAAIVSLTWMALLISLLLSRVQSLYPPMRNDRRITIFIGLLFFFLSLFRTYWILIRLP